MRRLSLLRKLILAMLLPSLIAFVVFGLLARQAAARAVEAELGRRLQQAAQLIARQISDESVALLQPGDEDSRTHRNLRRRLSELRDTASLSRVYVFASDHSLRVDTSGSPIGAKLYQLDGNRSELGKIFAAASAQSTRSVSSVLFRGHDGHIYKSGFAAIESDSGAVHFAVGVDGSAALYADLVGLQRTLLFVGVLASLLLTLLALWLGRQVSQPLVRLSEGAQAVGRGVLDRPVPSELLRGDDEVAVLSQTLETMREALLARDERMQMMLAGIAHEVRNPLGGMELFAGLLREELTPNEHVPLDPLQARSYVDRILRELLHLQRVVADFLLYARRPSPALQTVDLATLLGEVCDSVQAIGEKVAVKTVLPDATVVQVKADPQQIRRAVENLARNAVQACEGRAEALVTLSVSLVSKTRCAIQVRDNGPGIPDDVLPKIWTPFFTTRAQGTGLGLPFVREIIHDHHGTIRVETSAAGTVFTLELEAVPV
ncbi:MAG TPA: ATP-binding protein [Pseudomonadota bacterium]|nr:ATP-binding protein [Pseudomonadota bacterium]